MALTQETGAVVTGANTYVTLAQADSFLEDRGETVWVDGDDDAKTAALIKAADYLMQKYRLLWDGSRVDALQRMDWPRRGVPVPDFFDPFFRQTNVPLSFRDTYFIPEDTVPVEVQEAQMLLAAELLSSDGTSANQAQATIDRATKREKVGSLEVEYFGSDGTTGQARLTALYWEAEQRIEPFLKPTAPHTGNVVRS